MHELSVTQNIVEACSERAAGARVLRVTLEVGALTCVLPDTLRFCYDVATEGTALEDSRLEIVTLPALSRCRGCGRDVEVWELLAGCDCGSIDLEPPTGGDELRIRSMEIEQDYPEVS